MVLDPRRASAVVRAPGRLALEDDASESDGDALALAARHRYLRALAADRFDEALEAARAAARHAETLADIGHCDAARVLAATGRWAEAIDEQRRAARTAPASRRSFHLWTLGAFEQFAGRHAAALRTFRRAETWAARGRALVRAHAAYCMLEAGMAAPRLRAVTTALARSPSREGYGQFLLGMIAWHVGDRARASVHLRAFLRRNAAVDRAKAIGLREELRRAREVLARIDSD